MFEQDILSTSPDRNGRESPTRAVEPHPVSTFADDARIDRGPSLGSPDGSLVDLGPFSEAFILEIIRSFSRWLGSKDIDTIHKFSHNFQDLETKHV